MLYCYLSLVIQKSFPYIYCGGDAERVYHNDRLNMNRLIFTEGMVASKCAFRNLASTVAIVTGVSAIREFASIYSSDGGESLLRHLYHPIFIRGRCFS